MKRRSIFAFGLCSVLFASLLFSNVILAQDGGSYDPWIDTNDDGIIDAIDLQALAAIYSASGRPINKTELLLELETRIDSLNKTLLSEYYNITDCDNLFALLSHLHSGDDISGGTLRADQIRLGSSEASQIIYFYENGSEVGEWICWHDTNDRFWVSEDIYIEGAMQIDGAITIPTTTRYYSIPASAWQPYLDSHTFYRDDWTTWTETPGVTLWCIPVNLPHGAVVTEFKVWVYDASSTHDIDVTLYRNNAGHLSVDMASIWSSGSISDWIPYNDTSIDYATINNEDYFYSVHGRMRTGNSDHGLSQVRITYTITETLP